MLYFVSQTMDRKQAFQLALRQAIDLATKRESKELGIALHTKQNLVGSAIEAVLGRGLLQRGAIVNGVKVHLITERISSDLRKGPIIAAYASPKFLEKLIGDSRATDIIYLPWQEEDEVAFVDRSEQTILIR